MAEREAERRTRDQAPDGCCGDGGCGCAAAGPLSTTVSRRSFMRTLGASAVAASVAGEARAAQAEAARFDGPEIVGPGAVRVALKVNGEDVAAQVDPRTTLLEMLRLDLDRTGTKIVCDRGSCGACSVLVDGELVTACMMLAADAEGTEVRTVEGIASDGTLTALQEAFVKHDALQCGYCTPGLLVACVWLLERNPKPTLAEIKTALAGNICRCGTYTNIFNAVLEASGQTPLADAYRGEER